MDTLKAGTREYGDGEVWLDWWLLPRDLGDLTDEEVVNALDLHEHPSYYGGQSFSGRPSIRRSPHRTLVTRRAGYDV
jgi:hypothetical protein